MEDIRKVSIGPDYKSGAMHYIVGQRVLGDTSVICNIKRDTVTSSIKIYIKNERDEITLWKEFSQNVPVSIEFNIDF